MKKLIIVGMIAGSLLLGACATGGTSDPVYVSDARGVQSVQYGYVEDVAYIDGKGTSSGGGAVVGAIVGGVVGHQIGSGRGNTAATVAGAAGGAIVGNEIEKNRNAGERVEVRVRLDSGARVTYTQESPRDFHSGDRVRVEDGRVFRG